MTTEAARAIGRLVPQAAAEPWRRAQMSPSHPGTLTATKQLREFARRHLRTCGVDAVYAAPVDLAVHQWCVCGRAMVVTLSEVEGRDVLLLLQIEGAVAKMRRHGPLVSGWRITTVAALEAEIRRSTRTVLTRAAQRCRHHGHPWRGFWDTPPAACCEICLRLKTATSEGWPVWPER